MILAVLCLLTWAAAPPHGSVEGLAVNAVSGEPLRGVHVRLVAIGSQGPKAAYGAISDQQGRFSMAAVAPGGYVWMPEFRGFVYAGNEPSLSLKPGQRITDFRLEMTPRAVITGRVLDASGDPVQFVYVQATPLNPEDEALRPGFGSMGVVTDDRGEFRLSGAPGKYHIKANAQMMGGSSSQFRIGGAPEPVYGDTWYPSAASAERAGIVEVAPGADAAGIDIRLIQNRSLSISGKVRGVPEGGSATVRLATGGGPQSIRNVSGSSTGPDGSFTFTRVQPGWHRLMAEASGARLYSRPMDLSVETDVSDIEVQLVPGGELNGKLEIPAAPAGRRTVRLEPVEQFAMGQQPPATVDREGAFELHDISPGRFRVNVDGLPEAACVAAVSLDGAAAPNGVLDLSDPPRGGKLKVTALLDGAQVSGSVRDRGGEPLNTLATVLLARDPDDLRPGNMVRTEDGTFTFKGVCPGRYRLVALTLFQRGISGRDDVKKLIAKAEEFEVKKGERLTRDVKVDATKP